MQFIDLAAQQERIRDKVDARIAKVLNEGKYIMGPEVQALEAALSEFCGAKRPALSCSNGTDAISLVLMARGIGPGDAVFCPSFTFAATAEVVALQGAVPVFVDCHAETFNLDAGSLKKAVDVARQEGLKPRAIIAVDLFGLPADYDVIEPLAKEAELDLICDSAQGFGGVYKGRKVGTIGTATTTSFFPAKPLGCYGDGGAVFTEDADIEERMKSIRVHGKGSDKYDNARVGLNARLDTIQAAILLEKLAIFSEEIEMRNQVAARYSERLGRNNRIACPRVPEGLVSTWAQYTLRLPRELRDDVSNHLRENGIPSVVYYPKPLHQQTAYQNYPVAGDMSCTERLSSEVLSLPMHPYLQESDQDRVCDAILDVMSGS